MRAAAKEAAEIFAPCKFAANASKILKLKRDFFVKRKSEENLQYLYEKFTPQT